MFALAVHACMYTRVCMHAWVHVYLTHVCAYMCMCTHVYMYFWQYPPQVLKLAALGLPPPPPPPNIEKLPTPMRKVLQPSHCLTSETDLYLYSCNRLLLTVLVYRRDLQCLRHLLCDIHTSTLIYVLQVIIPTLFF